MARNRRFFYLMVAILAVAIVGCSTCSRKPSTPADGGDTPPTNGSGGNGGSTAPPVNQDEVPARVLDAIKRGPVSPDRKWQAAVIASGKEEEVGVWVASSDLTQVRLLSPDAHPYAGPPRWTPWNTLLFAVENALNPDVTWFEAQPADGTLKEFLPSLLKGKRAIIGPNAFSPDGKQFVFSTGNCLCANPPDEETIEVYLANVDGTGLRHLGTNVVAGFPGGELVVAPAGK